MNEKMETKVRPLNYIRLDDKTVVRFETIEYMRIEGNGELLISLANGITLRVSCGSYWESVRLLEKLYKVLNGEQELKQEPIQECPEWQKIPVDILSCMSRHGRRAVNICKYNDINTLGELVRLTPRGFLKFRNSGQTCIDSIKKYLFDCFGYEWQDYTEYEQ